MDLQDKNRFPLSTKDGHTPEQQARVDAFILDELMERQENGETLSDRQQAYMAELLVKEKIREDIALKNGWSPESNFGKYLAKQKAEREAMKPTPETKAEPEERSPYWLDPETAARIANEHREMMSYPPTEPIDCTKGMTKGKSDEPE